MHTCPIGCCDRLPGRRTQQTELLQQLLLDSCRSVDDDLLVSAIKANCGHAFIKAVLENPACELQLHPLQPPLPAVAQARPVAVWT